MNSAFRTAFSKLQPQMKTAAARLSASAKALEVGKKLSSKPLVLAAGGLTGVMIAGQTFFGSQESFYDHRFVTRPRAASERRGRRFASVRARARRESSSRA